MGFTFKVKVILKNINQEFNLTLPFGLTPPTGPRTGGVLRAAPAVGPRALRPCPLPDRLLRSLRQRVGPKGAGPSVLGPRGTGCGIVCSRRGGPSGPPWPQDGSSGQGSGQGGLRDPVLGTVGALKNLDPLQSPYEEISLVITDNWLSGFVEAEGCFGINRDGLSFNIEFFLVQKLDGRLLELIRRILHIPGKIIKNRQLNVLNDLTRNV